MNDTLSTRRRVQGLVLSALVCSTLTLAGPWSAAADAAVPGPALLTAVNAQDMGTFDRVTFTFRSGPTDALPVIARAEYVDPPVLADPSGLPVDVTGNAVLKIVMSNASGIDLSVNPPETTYTGPTRIQPDLPNVVDVVETGDFESVLSWAIGVRSGAAGANAVVLTSPTRVVVDIPHVVVSAVVAAPSFTG
jgi:hypothetical protein